MAKAKLANEATTDMAAAHATRRPLKRQSSVPPNQSLSIGLDGQAQEMHALRVHHRGRQSA
jgi:hypothetical protein